MELNTSLLPSPGTKSNLQEFEIGATCQATKANQTHTSVIINKIKQNGIQTLYQDELYSLKDEIRNKSIAIEQIKDVESIHEEKIVRNEKIKKNLIMASAIIIIAAIIFALAYFAAPAIAFELTTWLATGPTGVAPSLVASAKGALAAGTYIKLGAAHGILTTAYIYLPASSLPLFFQLQEKEKKRRLEYSKMLEKTINQLQSTS